MTQSNDPGMSPFNPSLWQGRIDREDPSLSIRLHQVVADGTAIAQFDNAPVLIGFACDEGVQRNQGRAGAAAGPDAIRNALAPLTVPADQRCYDLGTIPIVGNDMEGGQQTLGQTVASVLERSGFPVVLGGGHEVAWGSYSGLRQAFPEARIGILNFDAHFDLRNPDPITSSGTPFRQVAEHAEAHQHGFHYCVLGLNPSANSQALMRYAAAHQVEWIEDIDCQMHYWNNCVQRLSQFIEKIDVLYITVCMDAFSAADAPGVSAPAAMGINKSFAIQVLRYLLSTAGDKIRMLDIAETNPTYDRDGVTAKLAARLVWETIKNR
jgi:formiminoglutamase